MPFPVALLDSEGQEMPLTLEGETTEGPGTRMFELSEASHTWTFVGLKEKPVPSLNRGFAAPIVLDLTYSTDELALLARTDSDPFNRWEAMNRLMMKALLDQVRANLQGEQADVSPVLINAFGTGRR